MKILLAAGGSPFTQIAARHLVNHLQWFAKPPQVHLFHVHPSMPYPGAVGTHGHGALASLALGPVATKCTATLEVPIMIVRVSPPSKPLAKRGRGDPRRS